MDVVPGGAWPHAQPKKRPFRTPAEFAGPEELLMDLHQSVQSENLTRLRLRPTRCKEGGSGRAYEGYAEASPIEPLKRLVDPEGS